MSLVLGMLWYIFAYYVLSAIKVYFFLPVVFSFAQLKVQSSSNCYRSLPSMILYRSTSYVLAQKKNLTIYDTVCLRPGVQPVKYVSHSNSSPTLKLQP